MGKKSQEESQSPQWFIIKAITAPILMGTALLIAPWASLSGEWTDPLTALFMATSAMCVTGHTVVDPGGYFSLFGQLVLLGLIQLGGLGFMTLAMVSLVLLGRRLSIQSEQTLNTSLGTEMARNIRRLLVRTCLFTFIIEGLGALVLMIRLLPAQGFTAGRAFYYGVFHAISAFCNAGFTLFPDNLVAVREDNIFLLTVGALVILGGLGFIVINEFSVLKFWHENRLTRGRLSLHARVVVLATAVLIAGAWLLFALLEWDNSLASLDTGNRLTCALFQAITPRTAGFNVVDMSATHAATRFLTMLLMFIGGSPGSTAGGVKTTTAVVLLFTMLAIIRGKRDTVFQNRAISVRVVEEALAVFLLGVVVVGGIYGLLLVSEASALASLKITSESLLFETISAFGTVGLSTNIIPGFSVAGKLLIILGMFIGRVGPLTMALVVGLRDSPQLVRFPEEDVTIG